jgi:hypothetical protein
MENENWERVEETNGLYSISNMGRVKSHVKRERDESGRFTKITASNEGKIINTSVYGMYKAIDYRKSNNRKILFVHRLVGEYFVDNPRNKPCINHKNGDKFDNRASNIEWCTHKENMEHYWNSDNAQRGENSTNAKLTKEDVLEIRAAYRLGCFEYKDFVDAYGTSVDNIRHIIKRRSWKHI